ncbi:MAG: Holliday junction branch migration protein RuvA [Atopobiaceae bacterium]|nr:Holliday junction branch migration protein RuvA [Atopobiaceae bacterium]
MIVSLTGTLAELSSSVAVLDVNGVGYELGISATTAASLPAVGTSGVTLLTRMVVREGAVDLYGFSSRDERTLFDKLVGISHVGPKLALSVLSTFTPQALATVVMSDDVTGMSRVPGVGKKTASRLIMELADVFAKDPVLRGLAGTSSASQGKNGASPVASSVVADVTEALLAMGFTSQEAELALEGFEEAGASTVEAALGFALRRLGRRG